MSLLRVLKNIFMAPLIITACYVGGVCIPEGIPDTFYQKINSQKELEEELMYEKRRMNCHATIEAHLDYGADTIEEVYAHCYKSEGVYHIEMSKYGSNRSSLIHEMEHIKLGHLDDGREGFPSLHFFAITEPHAILHGFKTFVYDYFQGNLTNSPQERLQK